MTKGWRYEGYRHSLAAKGIKTSFNVKYSDKYKRSFKFYTGDEKCPNCGGTHEDTNGVCPLALEPRSIVEEEYTGEGEENEEEPPYPGAKKKKSMLFKKDETKGAMDIFKSPAEKYDQGHEISRTFSNQVKQKLMTVMQDLQSKGMMTLDDNRRFMEDQYAPLENKFIERNMDADAFKDEVDRSYKMFYQHHKKQNRAFGWADGNEEPEPTLYDQNEKRGTSIWGF